MPFEQDTFCDNVTFPDVQDFKLVDPSDCVDDAVVHETEPLVSVTLPVQSAPPAGRQDAAYSHTSPDDAHEHVRVGEPICTAVPLLHVMVTLLSVPVCATALHCSHVSVMLWPFVSSGMFFVQLPIVMVFAAQAPGVEPRGACGIGAHFTDVEPSLVMKWSAGQTSIPTLPVRSDTGMFTTSRSKAKFCATASRSAGFTQLSASFGLVLLGP